MYEAPENGNRVGVLGGLLVTDNTGETSDNWGKSNKWSLFPRSVSSR